MERILSLGKFTKVICILLHMIVITTHADFILRKVKEYTVMFMVFHLNQPKKYYKGGLM